MSHTLRSSWCICAVLSVCGSAAAIAQDVEMRARAVGRELPLGYYQRIARQPDAFEIGDGWIARAARAEAQGLALSDTLPLIVILGLFADSPEPHVSSAELQRVLFDGPSEYGTLTEFYSETSGGRFGVRGSVAPWVRTDVTLAEAVGESYGLGSDAQVGPYLLQSLAAVDAQIDFGLYDNDGPDGRPNSGDDDGFVDAVAFEFLEVSASCGGPAIWPHRWQLRGWADPTWTDSTYRSDDIRVGVEGGFIRVNDYIIQSTVSCDGSSIQTATTIAHELGHVIGLPDLYDSSDGIEPEHRRWVIGCWSLMAAGSWGCGDTDRTEWVRPTHLGPWEKQRLGWLTNVEVVENALGRDVTLEPVITSGHVLKIPFSPVEYYLVEFRTQQGFDLDLPSSGVLIYHIDESRALRPCPMCRVQLEEADGNSGLLRSFLQGGNRGEAGDAFGAFGPDRFTRSTNPSAASNSGQVRNVTFYDISLDGGVAHLTLSTVAISRSRLLTPFLFNVAAPLTVAEEEYLDRFGNRNGRFDVGDLRAYMQR